VRAPVTAAKDDEDDDDDDDDDEGEEEGEEEEEKEEGEEEKGDVPESVGAPEEQEKKDDDDEEEEEDVADSAANAPRFRENSDIQALQILGVSSLPKSTAVLEHFYWSQSHWTSEECISTLESLSTNLGDHSEFDDGYKVAVEHLNGRCTAFARLYGNTAFNELFQGAVTALDGYKGRESAQARSVVQEHLCRYAFIITPRMWSKYEICLIMCILLDSSLVYQAINQKTGLPSTETYQNR
jgi:hypothetical protein